LTTGGAAAGDKGGKGQEVPNAAVAPAWPAAPAPVRLAFASVYEEHFEFVYRTVRRLGVVESAAEDVAQEVFVCVHKSLGAFEGRSSVRTWLFGIARNVAYRHRRTLSRRITMAPDDGLASAHDASAPSAHDQAERTEAARVLDAILGAMDDEKREAFVLVELEEMSMPEVAEALGINVNTAYTRLRSARQQFEAALTRYRAKSAWGGKREQP